MITEPTEVHTEHGEHEGMTKKRIIKVAVILSVITCIEFIIALGFVAPGHIGANIANPIYVVLTLLKAFYIVGFFMHLKFEKAGLIIAVALPVLFIIGLILVLTNESHHWITLRM